MSNLIKNLVSADHDEFDLIKSFLEWNKVFEEEKKHAKVLKRK